MAHATVLEALPYTLFMMFWFTVLSSLDTFYYCDLHDTGGWWSLFAFHTSSYVQKIIYPFPFFNVNFHWNILPQLSVIHFFNIFILLLSNFFMILTYHSLCQLKLWNYTILSATILFSITYIHFYKFIMKLFPLLTFFTFSSFFLLYLFFSSFYNSLYLVTLLYYFFY